MEFLKNNYFETSTSLVVDSNTLTAENLLIRDPAFQYVSDGFDNDATTASLTINFDSTLSVSRIGIQGVNTKAFDVYYNGLTASTFNLDSTAHTTTSQFLNNSDTAMLLKVDAVNCTSVTFDLKSTIVANSEKAIGYIYLGDTKLIFTRIPTSKNYKPKLTPKEVAHKLSDGGLRLHLVDKKFSTKIKFKYITASFRDDLFSVWDEKSDFVFSAFETSSGWDGIFYKVVWPGAFTFYEYSEDSKTANFTGSITLNEVS